MKIWDQLSSKVLFENPWWTYRLDRFQIPDGISGEYHYVHTHGSSMVIPVTAEGEILMVQQYRYLCRRVSTEFPSGGVKPRQSHLDTARLELAEETGYQAGLLTPLGEFNPYNGITDEICQVFLAQNLESDGGDAKPDATEDLELIRCTTEELDAMIRAQEVWDGMTMAAWLLGRAPVLKVIGDLS